METSSEYKVEPNPEAKIYTAVDKRPGILTHPYTQTIKDFMLAMIASGYAYEDEDEIYQKAVEMTDVLIENNGVA